MQTRLLNTTEADSVVKLHAVATNLTNKTVVDEKPIKTAPELIKPRELTPMEKQAVELEKIGSSVQQLIQKTIASPAFTKKANNELDAVQLQIDQLQ